MGVHANLGQPKPRRRLGFQEVIYQRALAYEFQKANLKAKRELTLDIFYKEMVEPIGTRRADFLVEEKVRIELKATTRLDDVHLAQTLNYLKAYKIDIGLLLNFGEKSLQIEETYTLLSFDQSKSANPLIR